MLIYPLLSPLFGTGATGHSLGNALEATIPRGNQRNCPFGREARLVLFTRRPGLFHEDAGAGNSIQRADAFTFVGACTVAATAVIQEKRARAVATSGVRIGFSREAIKHGAAEPGAKLAAVRGGAVGLTSHKGRTREVHQRRFIDMGTWSTKVVLGATKSALVALVSFVVMAIHETTRTTRTFVTRRTAPKAADLVSVDAAHGEEEGSENDGKLGHHGAGCW
jgi:hypothetical protein